MVSRGTPYAVAALCLVGFLLIGCGEDEATGPPPTGSIEVSLSMTGGLPDADGCVVSIDDGLGSILLEGKSLSVSGLAVGTHTVTISDLAPNCSVQGEESRAVTVSASEATTVPFAVDCPAPGSIVVETATTGSAMDPDGYTVTLDRDDSLRVGVNDTATFSDLAVGEYVAELADVAENCTVSGENPKTVTVADGAATTTNFAVNCPGHGSIEVSTTTVGSALDLDGYTVTLDGLAVLDIGVNDADTFPDLTVGEHVVELAGVVDDCLVPDGNRRRATVEDGSVTAIDFTISCPFFDHIAFIKDGHMHAAEPSGSNPVDLRNTGSGTHPAWSPDATQIAYTCDSDICLLNIATKDLIRITDFAQATLCAWSPDGTRIAYGGSTWLPRGGRQGSVTLMNADGTEPINLTRGYDPAWSPDGSQIVYTLDDDMWVMQADGSSPQPLISSLGMVHEPAWSPDGTRIAYVGPGSPCCAIWVMNADGTNPTKLVEGYTRRPSWSPDSNRIAYFDWRGGVYVMNADGSGSVMIADGYYTAWSPGQP